MTLRYEQVLKDNTELRKNLKAATEEQVRKQCKINTLQRQVLDTEDALVNEAHSNASKIGANLLERFEIVDREGKTSQFIIQLQMKLLKAHEENDTFQRQMEELRNQNDGLLKQLSRVNENYAFERNETTKLCQKLKSQTEEVKSCEGLKLKVRELQFQTGKLRSELQDKESDLVEVKRWTEALKARFDLLVNDREKVLKNQELIKVECCQQMEKISDLKLKLGYKVREIEELKRTYTDLEENLTMCREERDFYCNAMKNTALELVELRKEREEVTQRYNRALEVKDTNLRRQIEYRQQLESKFKETTEELASINSLLSQEKAEKDELRESVSKLEAKLQKQVKNLECHVHINYKSSKR